jgi:hypothetical protein
MNYLQPHASGHGQDVDQFAEHGLGTREHDQFAIKKLCRQSTMHNFPAESRFIEINLSKPRAAQTSRRPARDIGHE